MLYELIVELEHESALPAYKVLEEQGEDYALIYLKQFYQPGEHEVVEKWPPCPNEIVSFFEHGFVMARHEGRHTIRLFRQQPKITMNEYLKMLQLAQKMSFKIPA